MCIAEGRCTNSGVSSPFFLRLNYDVRGLLPGIQGLAGKIKLIVILIVRIHFAAHLRVHDAEHLKLKYIMCPIMFCSHVRSVMRESSQQGRGREMAEEVRRAGFLSVNKPHG